IRQHGLKIEGVLGDLHLPRVEVSDDPAAVAPVDIVLFAVKLWDSEAAAQGLKPLMRPPTRVITFQNGIDARERLEPILGAGNIVAGLAQIATVIGAPGLIRHTSKVALLRCGHPDGRADPTLAAFVAEGQKAGIDIDLSKDIEVDLWTKFVFLSSLAGITAATRMPIGKLREDPDTRGLFSDLLREVSAVGRAKGVALAPDHADKALAFADAALPPHMKASMAHDLPRGNPLPVALPTPNEAP